MPLTLTRPDAVIFDMDGLLLDSERASLELHAQAAKSLDNKWDHAVGLQTIGIRWAECDEIFHKAFGADYPLEALRERFGELYEAAIVAGEIPPKPFARELLMRLDALRIPCAVAGIRMLGVPAVSSLKDVLVAIG